ncbi:MAG: radical SAM protein, partial [Gammaproteobacteria bacterium]
MTPDRATLRANLHLLDDKQTVFHAQSYQLFDVDPRLADVLEQLENALPLDGHFDSSRFSGELEALQHLDSAGRGDIQSDLEGIRHRSRCYYLFVTQECNLRCLYCYGDGGSYHKSMIPMQDDTLANFFERCITDKDMTYDLVFFGGEPLLNFPLLKKAVALGDEKRAQGFTLHYTLVTNGSISTPEVTRFLAEHIERVTVSLDGPKDYHDQQRPGKTRFSSHDRALKTLRKFRDVGMRTVVRTIITKLNYREVEDIYR